MSALLVLILLALTAVFLAGGVIYLYRWLVRRKLFPQLPRLWRGDRQRFFIASVLFVLSLGGFIFTVLSTGSEAPPTRVAQLKEAPGPSFDGQPPPKADAYAPRPAPAEERALPPKQMAGEGEQVAGQEKPAAGETAAAPGGQEPATPAPMGESAQPASQPGMGQEPAAQGQAGEAAGTMTAQAQPDGQAQAKATEEAAPAPEPKPEPEPEPQAEPPAQPKAEAAAPVQPTPPAEPAPEPKAEAAPKPKAPPKPEPKPEPKPQAKPPAQTGGPYTVVAASFRKEPMARTFQDQLTALGLKGEIHKVDLGAKGKWYRVCVGRFPDAKAAAAQARAYKEQGLVKTPFPARLR